jgi:hypothetical protein
MAKKAKSPKKAAAKPEAKSEALEEILKEVPEAKVVEERELPEKIGEQTTETKMVGGRLCRVIRTGAGVDYIPL